MAVYRKEKAGQRSENRGKNSKWWKNENKEKSRKRKNANLWTFPGRFIAVLCILLLILWRSESPVSSQQPEVICLTEGKNVRIINQDAGLESQRELLWSVQSESLERDESSQYESDEKGNGDKKITLPEMEVQTADDQQIWTNDTAVEIFKTADQNVAGEPTVQSSNSDKVIAPGTSGTYIFFLQNTGTMKVDYKVSLKAGWELEGMESPLEIRIADDNGWLAPCRSGWQSISNLSHITETSQLLPNQKARYTLYWRWSYERGKDEEDTSLGNDTEDTLHTIVIHTEAVQSISENARNTDSAKASQSAEAVKTADPMSPEIWLVELLFAELVLTTCLTVIWLRKRRSYNEKQ